MARAMFWLSRASVLRTLVSRVRLATRLLREPRVPLALKVWPLLAALYVITPIDVLPDFLPILGQLDDLGILVIAVEGFVKVCPPAAVDFHRMAIAQGRRYGKMRSADDVIEAEFIRDDDSKGDGGRG